MRGASFSNQPPPRLQKYMCGTLSEELWCFLRHQCLPGKVAVADHGRIRQTQFCKQVPGVIFHRMFFVIFVGKGIIAHLSETWWKMCWSHIHIVLPRMYQRRFVQPESIPGPAYYRPWWCLLAGNLSFFQDSRHTNLYSTRKSEIFHGFPE